MTYKELYEKAAAMLDRGEITLGDFNKMVKPLDVEIHPEPHWIPVTERLPEKSGRYFVTERIYHINDKEHTGGFILKTDFTEYSATEKKWRRAQALVVVAWMDNEPYKGVTT